jgi:23S rRNA pseudouridine2605 synthase
VAHPRVPQTPRFITTRRDPQGRKTVFDALGPDAGSLVAVGRLDLASTGLLLLTTDTQLAAWLTDPRNQVIRRYVVTARGGVSDDAARAMERGLGRLRARAVEVRKRSNRETHLIIELTEGRNREIRRLLQTVGHEVTTVEGCLRTDRARNALAGRVAGSHA